MGVPVVLVAVTALILPQLVQVALLDVKLVVTVDATAIVQAVRDVIIIVMAVLVDVKVVVLVDVKVRVQPHVLAITVQEAALVVVKIHALGHA